MKKLFLMVLALGMILSASAQNDSRDPGIYYIDGETSTPLTSINATTQTSGTSFGIVDVSKQKQSYKGLTSDTPCKNAEFVVVINPEKKGATQTLKRYDPFIKSMTPENMVLVPLEIGKKDRVYDEGSTINGFKTNSRNSIAFEYEQITDNSWKITAELPAGEYAWAFKIAKLGGYNFQSVFDFTIE